MFVLYNLPNLRARRHQAPNCPPVVLVAEVRAWVDVATVEVQVVRVVAIVRRGRPIVSVRTTIVHRRTIHVAGINE